MVGTMDITFLGTGSAQPSSTRNHQAIALRMNGDIWLFDCGEATQHQLQKSSLKMSNISRIFITHLHGDHCFGLAPLLCSMSENLNEAQPRQNDPPIEIYGPSNLRYWLRTTLKATRSHIGRSYRVHELLLDSEPEDPKVDSSEMHDNELPGDNWRLSDGHWQIPIGTTYPVLAASIEHSIPSLGFVIREDDAPGKVTPDMEAHVDRNAEALRAQGLKNHKQILRHFKTAQEPLTLPDGTVLHRPLPIPGRTVIILGDTRDPSSIASIIQAPDVLVHEATNALTFLDVPSSKEKKKALTLEEVEARAHNHGHSTPQMAGAFAKRIGAKTLILTHFSARYKGDDSDEGVKVMEEIRQQAVDFFGEDDAVHCARDLWTFNIERKP